VAPGCVLLDLLMPGMSGLALQAELKRRAIHLPLIVITGHGDVPAAVAALLGSATALQTLTERLARARGINPDPIHRDVDRFREAAEAAEAAS
jgi:FixJ family two-component response regulator